MKAFLCVIVAGVLVLAGGLAPSSAWAAPDVWADEFSIDYDTTFYAATDFEPDTRDPLSEPDFDGGPPLQWFDARFFNVGVIEENLSPVGDDPSYPLPDPGASTPEYAVLQPEAGDGPSWSDDFFPMADDGVELRLTIDIYADPAIPAIPDGGSDWWWTIGVDGVSADYITEAGMAADATDTIGGGPSELWTFMTTSGVPIVSLPTGLWYEMEVRYVQGGDGTIDGIFTVYDATGTIPLGSVTLTTLFMNPVNTLVGPDYFAFTFFTPNVDVLFLDDLVVETIVPEPSTLVMLGMGAIGLVTVVRRRRRT